MLSRAEATLAGSSTRWRTGTGRDGEWLRVSEYGYFAGEVRAWEDLARYFDSDDLLPATHRDTRPLPSRTTTAASSPGTLSGHPRRTRQRRRPMAQDMLPKITWPRYLGHHDGHRLSP